MTTCCLVIDINHSRCSRCKIVVEWDAITCRSCGLTFTSIGSNHAGLAKRIRDLRKDNLRLEPCPWYPELVSS